jgi:hypothetical protein
MRKRLNVLYQKHMEPALEGLSRQRKEEFVKVFLTSCFAQ